MKRRSVLAVAAITIGATGVGSAVAAATGGPAVVHPVLDAGEVGAPVGAGLVAGTGLGAVSTAIAPVAQQSPEAGSAVLGTLGQVTAAMSDGGNQTAQALSAIDDATQPLAAVVNPVVNPVLEAAAAQLDAQAPAFASSGFGADMQATATLLRWAKGS